MADPRAILKYEEIAAAYATFKIDNATIVYDSTKQGGAAAIETGNSAVTLSADDTIALGADGDAVLGKLKRVQQDLFATVQFYGLCTFIQGAAAATTFGKKFVAALGPAAAKGYIKEIANAAAAPTQAEFNNALKARGMILSDADVNAVAVML